MTTNLDLAKKVAEHVQLHSISLKSANIESSLDPTAPPPQAVMSQGHRCNFELGKTADERDKVTVFVDFRFNAKISEEDTNDLVVLTATFCLVYSLKADLNIDEPCFSHFANVNGPYNAWPYWRELVQSVTGRVGLAGVTIPVFRPRARELSSDGSEANAKQPKKKNVRATKNN